MLKTETDFYDIAVYWAPGEGPDNKTPALRVEKRSEWHEFPLYFTRGGARRLIEALNIAVALADQLENPNGKPS